MAYLWNYGDTEMGSKARTDVNILAHRQILLVDQI